MASSPDEEDLAAHGRNAWVRFTDAYQAIQKGGSAFSEQLDATSLRAEMQRFQLWAINVGLYRQDHSSLDYRLRDNEVVRSFTQELLLSLIETLGEITSIVSHSGDETLSIISESHDSDAMRAEDEDALNSRAGEGSHTSPIIMGALNDDNESMLTLHFEDVTEAINQLYNLAFQIRSPRTRKYRTDIDLYKDVDDEIKSEYVEMRKRAELQGIEQILLQSRKFLTGSPTEETNLVLTEEDECLIARLQRANHARRQQFEYWRSSKKRSIRAASKAMRTMPLATHNDDGLKPEHTSLVKPSGAARSLLSSVPALSKDFVLEHKKSTYTGTSRGLTVHGPSGEKVNWPKPPVSVPGGEDFECPFCFYLCGPRYSEDTAWRSHLKHDLRPYVCTYPECIEPNVLYDSWEEWSRHEQWAHQQRIWRCMEHPQHEYVDLASYENHVKTCHAASMHQMLSSELLNSQESVSQVCDRPCPFCQRGYERTIELQQHLAGHLESIALLSLPNLDNVDESSEAGHVNSNSANCNYAESKADDFDATEPPVFRENDHSEHILSPTETEKEYIIKCICGFRQDDGNTVYCNVCNTWQHTECYYLDNHGNVPTKEELEVIEHFCIDCAPSSLNVKGAVVRQRKRRKEVDLGDREVKRTTAMNYIRESEDIDDSHWLPIVFNQSRTRTPLEDADRPSNSISECQPEIMIRLSEYGYVSLVELLFDDGDFIVQLYQRDEDCRSIFLCHTIRPARPREYSGEPLVALTVARSGPFLNFWSVIEGLPRVWASLKFLDYELLVLFFCSFLSLRFEDSKTPVSAINDWEIHKEVELFAGRIIDDGYEHALRLFRENDTGVVRLQASVLRGELKRKPVWTAFVTTQIRVPGWASQHGPNKVLLADLDQHVFVDEYDPQRTSTGEFKLIFPLIGDTDKFLSTLKAFEYSHQWD